MTTNQFETWLYDLIDASADTDDESALGMVTSTETFEEVGMLTGNRGLVVKFDDGSEFQVTLVRSRCGRNDDE